MSKIKAVVFDMGGVLIDLDYDRCVAAYNEIGFKDITKYLDPCHQKGIYGELEEGIVTEDEFYDFVISRSNPGTTREDVDRCMRSFYDGPSEEVAAVLKSIKAKGYPVYMLSNNNPIMMRVCAADFEKVGLSLDGFFDKLFISCWMRQLKPGREIFDATISGIGCNPDEILFIDDSPRNVEGARLAGINAIYYKIGTALADYFTDL